MNVFQNGSDELFHLSPLAKLHESSISPICRPFPPELVLSTPSNPLAQYPSTTMQEGISEQFTGIDMQSEVSSGNTVST